MSQLRIVKEAAGHWLVESGSNGKPVALFFTHNVSSRVARDRAQKFVNSMRSGVA